MLIKRHMLDFIKGTYSLIDEKFDFCFNNQAIWGMRNDSRDAILVYNAKAEPGESYRFAHKAPFVAGMELKIEGMNAILQTPAFKSVPLPITKAVTEAPEYLDFDKSEFTKIEKYILQLGGKVTASNEIIASSPGKNMIFAASCRSSLGFTTELPAKADKFNMSPYGLEVEFTAVDHIIRRKIAIEPVAYGINDLPGVQQVFPDASAIKEALSIIPQIAMDRILLKINDDQLELNTSYGKLGIGLLLRENPSDDLKELHISRDGLISFLGFVLRNMGIEGFPGKIKYNNMGEGYFSTAMEAGYNVYAF